MYQVSYTNNLNKEKIFFSSLKILFYRKEKTNYLIVLKTYLDSVSVESVSISDSSVAAIKHRLQIFLSRYRYPSRACGSLIPKKLKILSAILLDSCITLSTVSRAPSQPPPVLPQIKHTTCSVLKNYRCQHK